MRQLLAVLERGARLYALFTEHLLSQLTRKLELPRSSKRRRMWLAIDMGYQCEKLARLAAELMRQQMSLTAAEVSEKLHVHRHTLRRALKASGRSFALIKQSFVLERLERHFASTQATLLKEIWTELGFASASAFARYIRRATGKSPHEFRADWVVRESRGN
jgi:AraC-like DNA-binding protein